jgi:flavin-dependent dehydrogenase
MKPQVIIIGAGPAGCTLAALLAMQGRSVLVFDDEKRPSLLVGESLIPAVVSLFRQLGIEERVKAICTHKPGAAFFASTGEKIHFNFQTVADRLPPYAYNAPRPEVDNLLRQRAEELGATFVKARAEVTVQGDQVLLSARCRELAGLCESDAQPLLVDASGRARMLARALSLPAQRGPRNDIAYFAHYEGFVHDEVAPGNIIISVLTAGWSWRIPLPGRLSVGIVINKEHAAALGDTPEERLQAAIQREPLLRDRGRDARRVTEVMTYTNYQLLAQRGHGPGWILLGDALGFVDPMLSPGLFMSMEGARVLAERVLLPHPQPGPAQSAALENYVEEMKAWHRGWSGLVEYFYNGHLFRAYEGGRQICEQRAESHPLRRFDRYVNRVVARMACGSTTRSAFSHAFLHVLTRYIVRNVPPASYYAIR